MSKQIEFTATELREKSWTALRLKDPGLDKMYAEVMDGVLAAAGRGEFTTSLSSNITNTVRMQAVLFHLLGLGYNGYLDRDHAMASVNLVVAWGNV
jgi:hypothetical protein